MECYASDPPARVRKMQLMRNVMSEVWMLTLRQGVEGVHPERRCVLVTR